MGECGQRKVLIAPSVLNRVSGSASRPADQPEYQKCKNAPADQTHGEEHAIQHQRNNGKDDQQNEQRSKKEIKFHTAETRQLPKCARGRHPFRQSVRKQGITAKRNRTMTHPEKKTDEARQAERKPGMVWILVISTAIAAIVLGIVFTMTAGSPG